MEDVFEPVTENQKQNQIRTKLEAEKQVQALNDCTQTTKQVMQDQTKSIQAASNAINSNLKKSIEKRIQEFDEIITRKSQHLTNVVILNRVD